MAVFLDYDGTLREIEREPAAAMPTPDILALLDSLRHREQLDVTIISGRSADDLQAWLSDYPFHLVAEHGASLRRAGQRKWTKTVRNISYHWKEELRGVLRLYEQSTPGSFVEEKRTSLVWHYRKTDPEFGTWKAHQLADELGAMMANEPVQIRHGRKIVEATSAQVSKGAAVRWLLEETAPDVVVCAGDDQTDESMFDLERPNFIAIKVGQEPSRAPYRLRDPAAFRQFLREAFVFSAETTCS